MRGIFIAVLFCGIQLAHADSVVLFDGHSLGGWRVEGDSEWSVVDQAIVASGSGDGFLVSEKDYGDVQLRVEFWVDATTNSGIFIRCRDRSRIHPETCYELNIWDEHPQQEARTGAIVKRFMPPMARVETVGKWNTLEVMARGTAIEVRINGATTAVLDNADPTAGFIALQHWADGTVKFRKLELNIF
jgi:Domain of Unknown Function (DUF1080)